MYVKLIKYTDNNVAILACSRYDVEEANQSAVINTHNTQWENGIIKINLTFYIQIEIFVRHD